jgi:hypothetical protein
VTSTDDVVSKGAYVLYYIRRGFIKDGLVDFESIKKGDADIALP